jgi:hypothetical protein
MLLAVLLYYHEHVTMISNLLDMYVSINMLVGKRQEIYQVYPEEMCRGSNSYRIVAHYR